MKGRMLRSTSCDHCRRIAMCVDVACVAELPYPYFEYLLVMFLVLEIIVYKVSESGGKCRTVCSRCNPL